MAWPGTDAIGLWLDWIDFEVPAGRVAALLGPARWRAAVVTGLVFLAMLAAGGRPREAALLAAPISLAATIGLLRDPWLVHGLLRGVPEALVLYAGALVLVAVLLRHWKLASRGDVALVASLLLGGFLLRALALNTPGYYYPDLRSHARLALAIRDAGLRFAVDPAATVASVGLWQNPLGGRVITFPYAPGFHLPLAASGLSFDDLLTAEKLLGAAAATLPVAFLFILARRIGAATLGAGLLLVAPVYGRHLAVAFLPALFGHAFDLGLVTWLQPRLERMRTPRVFLVTAVLVCACQIAYVSAVTLIPAFLVALALLVAAGRSPVRVAVALALVGAGVLGSVLSVLIYYRSFLGPILDALPSLAAEPAAGLVKAAPGLFQVALRTTQGSFAPPDGLPFVFQWTFLSMAVVGLVPALRRETGRPILAAWLLAYALLLLGRTLAPSLFQFQHEALFVAPLLCLAAGEALAWLWSFGDWRRWAAGALGLFLCLQGLRTQAEALLAQLGHAR